MTWCAGAPPLSVGIDLVEVADVEESLRVHGRRYLNRVFDQQEQRAYGRDAGRLASCLAVKEATVKALAPDADDALGWREIGLRGDTRVPAVELSGAAALLAQRVGVRELEVALSRDREHACAVVIAELVR
ncbi:MAG: 4'-phosphopantetheinyl transferase superfamily protein [Actinomycetota bacterium]|nr:4'-phosphopantetheinyl transferase superfamily protein [Actinomycetota bacterium]